MDGEQQSGRWAIAWDGHVHVYRPAVLADPFNWAKAAQEPLWAQLMSSPAHTWLDERALLERMDRDGVQRALLVGWYWQQPSSAHAHNEWMSALVRRYPDRFAWLAAWHPDIQPVDAWLGRVHACGACGVGECLPQAQHEEGIAHPAWDALIAGCSSMEWPILVHLTDPHGPAYAGRVETPLDAMLNCFAAHPRQHFIAAHWAGGLPLSAHGAAALRALPNVWLDTAASARLYPPSVWRQAFDAVGPQRIIFGSDFPLRNYPYKKEPHGPGWQGLLQEIAAAGLAMTEREAMLGGNLQRLLMLAAGRSRD